eukprot:gene29069-36139_t
MAEILAALRNKYYSMSERLRENPDDAEATEFLSSFDRTCDDSDDKGSKRTAKQHFYWSEAMTKYFIDCVGKEPKITGHEKSGNVKVEKKRTWEKVVELMREQFPSTPPPHVTHLKTKWTSLKNIYKKVLDATNAKKKYTTSTGSSNDEDECGMDGDDTDGSPPDSQNPKRPKTREEKSKARQASNSNRKTAEFQGMLNPLIEAQGVLAEAAKLEAAKLEAANKAEAAKAEAAAVASAAKEAASAPPARTPSQQAPLADSVPTEAPSPVPYTGYPT